MAKAPLKSDPHYLVSPRGTTVPVANAVELHNLLARGYKPQSRTSLDAVVDAAVEHPAVLVSSDSTPSTPDQPGDGGGPDQSEPADAGAEKVSKTQRGKPADK